MSENKTALIKAHMLSEAKIQLDSNINKHELYSSTGILVRIAGFLYALLKLAV